MKVKVPLGLSGGVDSAVSAYLLQKKGFDVSCVYLNCYDGDTPGCRGDNDRKDALAVAMHLGLPFQVLNFKKEYQAAVIDYFKKEYLAGRTPNPDVICNRDIKFGLFLDWAIKSHFDVIATGHYAKKTEKVEKAGKPDNLSNLSNLSLLIPTDLHKDQTYFLWAVPKEKFKRVLFPLGDLLKTEVREIARKAGLLVADKKDSTGICFVGEVRVEEFLKRLGVKEKIGEVMIKEEKAQKVGKAEKFDNLSNLSDLSNHFNRYQVIGSHRGVWFYTIGQRHGFEITNCPPVPLSLRGASRRATWQSSEAVQDKPPLYVVEKDIKKNRLIVGFGAETYRGQFTVSQLNWLASKKARPCFARPGLNTIFVRIRHGGELIPCCIEMIGDCSLKIENCPAEQGPALQDKLKISLSKAQRGIAPGQSAVFYDKNGVVLGGGVIQ